MKATHALLALATLAMTPALAAPTIGACPVFPRDSVWNAKVDALPVHPRSAAWVANVRVGGDGAARPLKADFGSGLYPDPADDPQAAAPIGIPWITVPGSQPKIKVVFSDYGDESDAAVGVPATESPPGTYFGMYPIPSNAPIEGAGPQTPADFGGDRHVLVIDTTNCILYETGNNYRPGVFDPNWVASGGAIWDLRSTAMRTLGYTSADAAGLPIFPGLARYEEVAAGVVEHALRFTADRTQRAYIWPASHFASSITNPDVAPMGARFRLKASKDISGLPLQARILAQAMKTYGIILADNGSSWFVSGAPHPGWDNDQLRQLNLVLKGSDFEAVDTSSLIVSPTSYATPPTTVTLTAAKTGAGTGTVTSSVGGISCGATCAGDVPIGQSVTLTATAAGGSVFTGWSGGGCAGAGTCTISPTADVTITSTFALLQGAPTLLANNSGLDFGGQSVQTTSLPRTLWLTNGGNGTITVSNVSSNSPSEFVTATACATLAAAVSCPVEVRFKPAAGGPRNAMLTVTTSAGSPTYSMTGTGEVSLVTHFYQAILNREPDASGKAFWQGEAGRMGSLGANINETWFVMAGYFFNSAEYLGYNKADAAFVTDLYNTFFNRGPDGAGLAFWTGQIQSGLPREVVLFSFMFSTEFATFTQGIFGNTTVRPEINLVMDFFRGILNRLPDTGSFNFWLGQVRTAQCQGANAVYAQVDSMSSAFIFNAEYNNRQRNNTQFVTDMYYSFLRRGGDLQGVQFWVNQLNSGAKTFNTVRSDFIGTPEFAQRVQAVINAGCTMGP